MNRLIRAALLVLAAGAFACNPKVEGACKDTSDCKAGTVCFKADGATEGVCIASGPTGCNKACGDAFHCVNGADGSESCDLDEGKGGTAQIGSPATGSVLKGGAIFVGCHVVAPQFRSVQLTVTEPGGQPKSLGDAVLAGTDEYQASWDASASAEGNVSFDCVATYGPDGYTKTVSAPTVTVKVDHTAPAITHTAPTNWFKRAGSTTLSATITDAGSGIDPASVVLALDGMGDTAGTSVGQDGFTFAVDLSQVLPPNIEGELHYTIKARDRAGNDASVQGSLHIDARPPEISIAAAAQQQWHGYSAGTFTVVASVSASGAAVVPASVKLKNADGSVTLNGQASGDNYSFTIDPTAFGHDGVEGASGWSLEAADEAGNTASSSGTFQIDGKKPALTVVPDTAWHKRGTSVDLAVHASDLGVGLDPASVKVRGGATCVAGSGDAFTCTVSTASAPANVETPALPYTIDAADKAGNAISADGFLKVDDKAPTLTITPDGKFYARGATIVVRGNAADAGSGIDASSVKIVSQTGSKTFTGNYDAASGDITINVTPAQFAPAGQTTTNNVITLFARDAMGLESQQQISLKIDDQAPTVTVGTLAYPNGGTAILRNGTMPITATITDPNSGAGVDNSAVFMEFTKADGSTAKIAPNGAPVGGTYTFSFDAKAPDFKMDSGTVTLTFEVADLVGNGSSSTTKQVQITRKLWEFNAGLAAKVNGSVAYSGGKLFFTLNANDSLKDNVFAVNAADGTKLWSAKVAGTPTTPVSLGQSLLYFGSDALGGSLHAFSPTQATAAAIESWECNGYGVSHGALAVAAVPWQGVSSETVFYPSNDPGLYAMRRNSSSGCDLKTAPINNADPSNSTVAVRTGGIVFGLDSGRIGKADFTTTASLLGSFTTSSAPGSTAVSVSGPALDSSSQAFFSDASAFVRQPTSLAGANYTGSTTLYTKPALAPPTLASDSLGFFGSDDGYLFAFDTASNAPKFATPVLDNLGNKKAIRTSPIIGSHTGTYQAYVGATDGKVHAFDASGTELWNYNAGSAIETSAALDCAGVLYVGTSTGHVIALVTDSDGLANSSWPRYQHDNKNTGNLATPIYVNGVCQD